MSGIAEFWKIYRRRFIIALLVLYLPHLWVIWVALRWPSDQHWMWVAFLPGMPGGYVAAVFRVLYWNQFQQHLPDSVLFLVAILITLLLIAILTTIGARGKGWQIAAIVLGGGYSIVAAMGLYAASRV